jgi:preprotein translocase subunit SecA
MYNKLAGMTGTADTEAYEFQQIYGLETVVIPTHRPMVRKDLNDLIYKTADEKHTAIIADIKDCANVGSRCWSALPRSRTPNFCPACLIRRAWRTRCSTPSSTPAKEIVPAGRPGVITIATNMAGRGTDIVLGGNIEKQVIAIKADESLPEAERGRKSLKCVLNGSRRTTRFWPPAACTSWLRASRIRRIDNQLRGRAGRQGDAGSSRFYLSLDDPLLRIFAGERLRAIMDKLKMPEGEAIEHRS